MSFEIEDINVETKAVTVRAACKYLVDESYDNLFALDYVDTDGNTASLLPDTGDGETVLYQMAELRPTALFIQNAGKIYQQDTDVKVHFAFTFQDWWARRAQTYGWLNDMMNRRDYDPLENYDRKEDGGWKDTTDIGARSASDIMGATQETTTDTPSVKTTVKSTPGVTDTVTETPAVTETVTETPTVTTTVTETPTVTTTVTETPAVTDTVVETPRVAVTTTNTPGVTMTTHKNIYGDNSSTAVPVEDVITSPGASQHDTTVVEPTSGTNQTQTSHTGTNQTVTGHTGNTQTVTGHTGNTQTVTGRTGTNQTVTGHTGFDTEETSYTGNNQSVKAALQHTDQHTALAAQDVVTRLYQQYRVHGNIGVTQVADMLSKELGLRKGLDLVKMAINEFLDLYTVYIV